MPPTERVEAGPGRPRQAARPGGRDQTRGRRLAWHLAAFPRNRRPGSRTGSWVPSGLSLNFPSGAKARIVKIVAPDPGRCTREIRGGTAGPGFFIRWAVQERRGGSKLREREKGSPASLPA